MVHPIGKIRGTASNAPLPEEIENKAQILQITPTLRGSRPSFCEIPATFKEPMGVCAFKEGSMSGCGCPAYDPRKYPQVWKEYIFSIEKVLSDANRANEITITFFGSGHMLQILDLFAALSARPTLKNYQGQLTLQCIDEKYQATETPKYETEVKTETDPVIRLIAIIAGILTFGLVIKTFKTEKKEHQAAFGTVAAILGIATFALAANVTAKKESKIKIISETIRDPEAKAATDEFNIKIQELAGRKIQVATKFFESTDACNAKGKKSDLITGYDIDEAFDAFNDLRARCSKSNAPAIVVGDRGPDPITGVITPILRRADGPNDPLRVQPITQNSNRAIAG